MSSISRASRRWLRIDARGEVVVFTHTVVPPNLQGRGVGSALIEGALTDICRAGLRVIAECPCVAAYIGRHPAESELLA